jgi:hypothetical protein
MRHIKLFESFDRDEDYIVSSIRDILIELQDEGMEIEIDYQSHSLVTIEIKGKTLNTDFYDTYEEFEVSSVRDYIDTVIDFIEDIWPSYNLYFEKYDTDDAHIEDGKVLTDGPVGSVVIQIYKKEI